MSVSNIERAKELNKKLTEYDHAYFVENKSLISDEEYDLLWFELRKLLEDVDVKKALSKTEMSIGVQTSYLSKISHAQPILSLDKEKIDDPDFSKKLDKFIKKYETDGLWTISSKLDGLTIVMYSQNGSETFATRGGSSKGENVTQQFVRNVELMNAASKVPNMMSIRGEGIISKSSFNLITNEIQNEIKVLYQEFVENDHYHLLTIDDESQEIIDKYLDFEETLSKEDVSAKQDALTKLKSSLSGYDVEFSRLGKSAISKLNKFFTAREKLYSNARNLASASVRTNDTTTATKNDVRYVVYDILNSHNFGIKTEIEVIDKLKEFGFETVKQIVVTTEELKEFFKDDSRMNQWRDESEYEIDGLVIKPNLKIENPKVTGHHVKGQLAIKFKPQGEMSVLRDVEWNLTSNGRYSPVAIFDQVVIGGSVITRASLNSYKSIEDLDLKIGDKIYVVRANDVIPQVAFPIISERTGNERAIELPDNAELKGGIVYAVKNVEMPLDKRINKFMTRLGAKGFGLSFINKLIDAGYLESISDLFLLHAHADSIQKIKGIGKGMVESALDEIESLKPTMTFTNVIFALGVEGLGRKAVEDIVDLIPTVKHFELFTYQQLEESEERYGLTQHARKGLESLMKNPDDLLDLNDMGLIRSK